MALQLTLTPPTVDATSVFKSRRLNPWPNRPLRRHGLRAALALPGVLLVLLVHAHGLAAAGDARLVTDGQAIRFGSRDLRFVGGVFPPLPTALGAIVPGGTLGLALLGAVCCGQLLQMSLERISLRSNPMRLGWLLVVAVMATPLLSWEATTNFAGLLGLCLMALAMTGLLDFSFNRSTESGFLAGLAFGAASMCDLSCACFALAASVATILLGRTSADFEPRRGRATLAVLLFPTVALLGGWTFVEWRFTGSATAWVAVAAPHAFSFPNGPLVAVVGALGQVGRELLLTPTLLVAIGLLARRRQLSVLACSLPVLVLVGLRVLGLPDGLWTGTLLLEMLGLIAMPEAMSPSEQTAVALSAVGQLFLVWHFASTTGAMHAFLAAIR